MVDVTLGVFVEPTEARIALVEADPPNALIDQSEIDLSTEPDDMLVTTLLATARALTDSGHRLVGTSLCSSDIEQVSALRDALAEAGLHNAAVIPEEDAVTAAVRALSGEETVATLVNDGTTVALSMVGAGGVTTPIAAEPIDGDPESAYRTLLQRFAAEPGAATGLIVMGSLGDDGLPADVVEASPVPLQFPDDSEFILARGAALASFWQDATTASPILRDSDEPPTAATPTDHADTVQGQKLAYSEVPDEDSVDPALAGPVLYDEFDDELELVSDDETEEAVRRRQWLIGSSVGALAAVGFATLAVSVAITVEPTTSQQAVRLQDAPVAGKAFPVAPGQGVEPDGPNWTMIEHVPPPGAPAEVRTFHTRALSSTREVANAAAPAVVNVYRDGTVGVQSAAAPLLPVDPVPIAPGLAPPFAELPDYVTRLIPDFSKIKPSDLLYFLANLRQVIPLDATAPSLPEGLDLDDIGVLATVPKDQGALFNADDAAAGPNVIPQELFDPDATTADKAQILPAGSTVIDPPPTDADGEEAADVLSEALVDPETVPRVPATQLPGQDDERDEVPEETGPTSDAEPGPETTAPRTESRRSPTTSVPTAETEVPTRQSPTSTPEPTDAPAPEPVTPTQAPPTTQAPTTQAPPATQAPATQAPPTQAPATQAPATQAPAVTQAPETVAPRRELPVTTLPQLPAVGGSFGSGADGD